jgi:hypothetical protein
VETLSNTNLVYSNWGKPNFKLVFAFKGETRRKEIFAAPQI